MLGCKSIIQVGGQDGSKNFRCNVGWIYRGRKDPGGLCILPSRKGDSMKLPHRRQFLHLAAGAATLIFLTQTTLAQTWPSRPVTMVVPIAAGSSMDVLARILAARLSELLGQSVIVENVSGGGGVIGASRVAKAAPDGYQLLFAGQDIMAQNQFIYKSLPYNSTTDFAPVGLIVEAPFVLLVRKDLPVSSLQEFEAYAKRNQARMQYGSAGTGAGSHLACVLLNRAAGLDVTHIPYRGGAPAMQDLIAGRIDYQCSLAAVSLPQVESGTVKAIAVLTKERSEFQPSLPSAHEQGLTDLDVAAWFGFFVPKGTPAPIVERLHAAILGTMATPSVAAKLFANGATVVSPQRRSPQYLQRLVETEIAKWGPIINAAGIKAE